MTDEETAAYDKLADRLTDHRRNYRPQNSELAQIWAEFKGQFEPLHGYRAKRMLTVMRLRWGLDGFAIHTYKAIAEEMDISRDKVLAAEAAALALFRRAIYDDNAD